MDDYTHPGKARFDAFARAYINELLATPTALDMTGAPIQPGTFLVVPISDSRNPHLMLGQVEAVTPTGKLRVKNLQRSATGYGHREKLGKVITYAFPDRCLVIPGKGAPGPGVTEKTTHPGE